LCAGLSAGLIIGQFGPNNYLHAHFVVSSWQTGFRKEDVMYGLARHTGTWLVAVALMLGGMAGGLARADNPPVFIDEAGRAIDGYDTVAYFTDGQPLPGDAAYSQEWQGAVWLFASAEHRDAFAANPEKYAPQFGGYCAYAISKGHAVKAKPEVWSRQQLARGADRSGPQQGRDR
jgi:YHS domain-containing protein